MKPKGKVKTSNHVTAEYFTEMVSWSAQIQSQIIMRKCQKSQMCPIQLPTVAASTTHLYHNT